MRGGVGICRVRGGALVGVCGVRGFVFVRGRLGTGVFCGVAKEKKALQKHQRKYSDYTKRTQKTTTRWLFLCDRGGVLWVAFVLGCVGCGWRYAGGGWVCVMWVGSLVLLVCCGWCLVARQQQIAPTTNTPVYYS